MIRTQVSLDAKMYRLAQATARRQGVSLAEFVRRALAKSLEPEVHPDKPWMRWSGFVRDGAQDDADADNIDSVVYDRAPEKL